MSPRYDSATALSASIIRRAARSVPGELAERLEEEWLADLASRGNPLTRLRLALGCCWASRVIAHDFLTAGAAARAESRNDSVITLGSHSPFSRRSTIFVLIAGLHVVLIYAVASGFAVQVIKKALPPATGQILPRVPNPKVDPPRIIEHPITHGPIIPVVTPPVIDIDPPVVPPPHIEAAGVAVDASVAAGSGAAAVKRVPGGPGVGFPNTDDYYPASAIRQGEEGAAAIRVCVNQNGQLSSDPSLLQSSGFALLDEGALKLAKAGSGHYRTTTEDGRPISDCYSFRVRFKLKH